MALSVQWLGDELPTFGEVVCPDDDIPGLLGSFECWAFKPLVTCTLVVLVAHDFDKDDEAV